ncbi:MAG: T9SS type A sorting domain-containing protein [Prevotella sp.]|jgi:hypothetical protein|nr:T9SS type A sorting domain-containing protein [Prevotella sp.]
MNKKFHWQKMIVSALLLLASISVSAQFPMGYIDENRLNCYTNFKSTGFSTSDMFQTKNVNKGMWTDWNYVNGFTVPLIGDLNGDGKPEVVVVSFATPIYEARARFLYIFDGQTGKLMVKKRLHIDSNAFVNSWHGTPCNLLLMNVDHNDTRQIVVAYGADYQTVSGKWSKRLVCYEVTAAGQKGLSVVPAGTPDAGDKTAELNSGYLSVKWVSDKRFDYTTNTTGTTASSGWTFSDSEAGGTGKGFTDAGGYYYSNRQYFCTPLPQLVDFDGDGVPEIYVYNKIYDASTGKLKLMLEDLGPASSVSQPNGDYLIPYYSQIKDYAFVGRDRTATNNGSGGNDSNAPYAYIYDLDRDGVYDIAAGGKVYYGINFQSDGSGGWNYIQQTPNTRYKIIKDVHTDDNNTDLGWGAFYPTSTSDASRSHSLGDGHTAVADINGDGIAEVVVLTRTPGTTGSDSPHILTVYNPGFFRIENGNVVKNTTPQTPTIIAQITIPISSGGTREGNHSYLYIADLDGQKYKGKYLPEISFIAGRMFGDRDNFLHHRSNPSLSKLHPLIRDNAEFTSKLHYTSVGDKDRASIDYSGDGALLSFTYDEDETDVTKRLKVSFVLEHKDRSLNTGFTLFDFDNDGKNDICYRDEQTLRIISVESPYYVKVSDTEATNPLIKYSTACISYTGYEYPVIADMNGDFSADIIVTRSESLSAPSWLYAVEANTGAGKTFAPAPGVWNQFMYSPLKINEDLTVPSTVYDPLSQHLAFAHDPYAPNDKRYIYNNTLVQTPIYANFKELKPNGAPGNPADSIYIMRPITKTPDVKVTATLLGTTLSIKIKNAGDATLGRETRFAVYRGVDNSVNVSTLTDASLYYVNIVGEDIYPNDSTEISITNVVASDDYIIRVSDANVIGLPATSLGIKDLSAAQKVGYTAGKWKDDTYLECNWADNWIYTSDFVVNNDVWTVLPYGKLDFDVLSNDLMPPSCPNPSVSITLPSGSDWGGITVSDGLAVGSHVAYKAPGAYSPGVVEINYSVTCSGVKKGKIYIYVLETNTDEFSACAGEDVTITLKEQPAGTTFLWWKYDAANPPDFTGHPISKNGPGTFTLNNDTLYWVRPLVSPPYDDLMFPQVLLSMTAIPSGAPTLLRWKGSEGNGEWHDPYNWATVVANGAEYLSGYVPNTCTDVEIPSGITSGYPKLSKAGRAGRIYMKDRAMLANTHLLDYDSVSVEVNFTAAERNRWVMYSAPLRRTYSGDFMLRDAAEIPLLPDINPSVSEPAVYMSFFQSAYPDDTGIAAQSKAFTQSFGALDAPLPLGKSFNIWIDTNVDTGTAFRFPSPLNRYDYWVHSPGGMPGTPQSTGLLNRADAVGKRINGRFITEEGTVTDAATGQFSVTPPDETSGFAYIMAPNPFMAYLDMQAFLTANSATLENHYKVWNGADGTFITYKAIPLYRPGQPYFGGTCWISDTQSWTWDSERYVSPLQSFIVEKKNPNSIVDLIYNPAAMTDTRFSPQSPYGLKSAKETETPDGVLFIIAGYNAVKNSTVLVNIPGESNSYSPNDAGKLFYDNDVSKPQLSVYTLTPESEALAINASGDFDGVEIPVGVRTNITGKVRLDFSGVEKFGHKVYLLDGNKEIDLNANPSYTAAIAAPHTGEFYEINDRFALRFLKNGTGIETIDSHVRISSEHGKILIRSDEAMNSVEVLSASGLRVFLSEDKTCFANVDVAPERVYIVKIMTEKGVVTRKVIVK